MTVVREPDHFDPDLVNGAYGKSKAAASSMMVPAMRSALREGIFSFFFFASSVIQKTPFAHKVS